ncbi:hypothetical protein DMB44_09085 [Thermoplasma sp. Kam2015]|uniref:hypothetical protein n=1 Tax=Thermoplasma sp. Kam2015 TaxID=2094122 RepID=UPI000D85B492|nr:hypothetical protein [Thermoplasma sp. Kam2015]PYB67476.1 hypothetical protein DMB44_09085 [Thermoplasma sp. Kam2015]
MEEKLVVTYGATLNIDISKYAHACDLLEEDLKRELKKYFPEPEFLEDDRNGESFSIRIRIPAGSDPPENIMLKYEGKKYVFELLELAPERYIYPDKIQEIVYKYFDKLRNVEVPFAELSIGLILEAMDSLSNKIYEGVAMLCRAAIDSSLYLACTYVKKTDQKGNTTLVLAPPESFLDENHELKDVYWGALSKEARNIFPNLSNRLNNINTKARKLGNFAAHIGERQLRENQEWLKKYRGILEDVLKGKKSDISSIPGYKIWTSCQEAEDALMETVSFLMDLVDNYQRPKDLTN